MKKITLLILLFVCTLGFSQRAVSNLGVNNPVVYGPQKATQQSPIQKMNGTPVSRVGESSLTAAIAAGVSTNYVQPAKKGLSISNYITSRPTNSAVMNQLGSDYVITYGPKNQITHGTQEKQVVSNNIPALPFETERELMADANYRALNPTVVYDLSVNVDRSQMADIIPTAGATETFTPNVGDHFFDPGGPGGSSTGGTAGNYPNCACTTLTTLAGVTEVDFQFFSVFATFDWLKIYDGTDTTGPVLFNNATGGANAGDITLADMIASHGSSVFNGTSGALTFEFFATGVVDYGGWDAEIIAAGGGGGGGNADTVMYLHHDTDAIWNADVQAQLMAAGIPTVDLWDGIAGIPTLVDLQAYDAVLISTDFAPGDPVALGNVLAEYADAGGGIVEMLFSPDGTFGIGGNFAANYSLYNSTGILSGTMRTLGTVNDPAHPIMQGVSTFSGGPTSFHLGGSAQNGGVVIAEYDNGTPLVVAIEGIGPANVNHAYINFFPPSDATGSGILWDSTTDGAILMKNALDWVSGAGGGGGGGCATGVYTDRASFDAEAGAVTLEDLAGGPGGIVGCGLIISEAGDSCYAPGEIQPGIEITANNSAGGQTVYVENGNFGLPNDAVGSNTFVDYTILNFPNNDVNSFAFDLYGLVGGSTMDIRIFGTGGLITTETVTDPGGAGVFFGYIATETIVSVEIEDLSGATVELVSLISFGECAGGGGGCTPDSLATTLAGGNGNFGNMFDINSLTDLTIDSFDIHGDNGATFDVEVWAKTGTWVGSENTPGDWTLIGTAPGVVSNGDGVTTPLGLALGYSMAAGETHAFYVVPTDTSTGGFNYTNGTTVGAVFASDANIEFLEGAGNAYPFGTTFMPRVFNGNILYCVGGGGGGGPVCSEENPNDFTFENGLNCSSASAFQAANDVTVADGEDFEINQITASIFANGGIALVDVIYYDDAGGLPGAVIGSEAGIVPTSQVVIGSNFGFDVNEIVLDLTPFNFAGQNGSTTKYWVELSVTDGGGTGTVFWVVTSSSSIGNGTALFDGGWGIFDPALDGVYIWSGECNPLPPDPTYDTCDGARPIACGEIAAGSTIGATVDSAVAPTCDTTVTAPGVWYVYEDTTGLVTDITITMCNGTTDYDAKLSVYTGDCGAPPLTCVVGNDDTCGLQSEVSFQSDGATTFYILVHGFASSVGNFEIEMTCTPVPPPNDMIANSIDVDEIGFPYTDPAVAMPAATTEAGTPAGCDNAGVKGVWYNFVPTGDGDATASITTPGGGLMFTVNNGPLAGDYPAVAAAFGGAFTATPITEDTAVVVDDNSGGGTDPNDACDPITNGGALSGKIAIIRRGACAFTGKVLAAQNAGAIAVIMVNNVPGDPIIMGGTEPLVTIPALMLSDVDGEAIIAEVSGGGTVNATMVLEMSLFSSVTFYTAPNENSVETDLELVPYFLNQCLPGISATIETVAGQAYYVYVANHGAITDIVIDGTNLGVEDNTLEGFTYYPNPTSNTLNLRSVESIENVEIYNILGQKVIDQKVNATTSEISVSELATGTYILRVSVNGQIGTYKILKQ